MRCGWGEVIQRGGEGRLDSMRLGGECGESGGESGDREIADAFGDLDGSRGRC